MSYCRFLEGDVYAYACDGGVQFWVSDSLDRGLNRLCNTYGEAYRYAKELRDEHGLDVPDYAIEALKEDALEEAVRINGKDSTVNELLTENAELREMLVHMELHECPACANVADLQEALSENDKLRELLGSCAILLTDHDFLHWPELLELTLVEMRELGIEVGK